jgi:hypothetical protein
MYVSTAIRADRGRRRACRFSGLVVAGWFGLTGCRDSGSLPSVQVYDVKGKVLLVDGKPLGSGWVYFVPKGDLTITPSGQIGPDGSFSLVTGGSGNGAPPGEYKVRIEAPQFQSAQNSRRRPFPFKYADEDSSGLVVTVRAEANQLKPFQLK